MSSYECYNMRHNLYTKSEALHAELDAAEETDNEAWTWYDSLTEEEYLDCQVEADRRVDETSREVRRLRGAVAEVEAAIRHLDRLEVHLGYLEAEGII